MRIRQGFIVAAAVWLSAVSTAAVGADEPAGQQRGEQEIIDSLMPAEWQKPLGEPPRMVITLPQGTDQAILSADGKLVISSRFEDTIRINRVVGEGPISRDGRTLLLMGRKQMKNVRPQVWIYDISRFTEPMGSAGAPSR